MTHTIQNADVNVGPGHYKTFGADKLLVTSIFLTIQGEGPFAAEPAVFVRLAGCDRGAKQDMGCEFCDTAFQVSKGTPMSFEDITKAMAQTLLPRYTGSVHPPLVVITGGEPMMQNNISAFVRHLRFVSWKRIQVESNGDRLAPEFPDYLWATLVVSPKAHRTGYGPLNLDVAERLNFLKCVVEDNPDSAYYNVPSYASKYSPELVYVSPLTVYQRELSVGEVPNAWNSRLIDVRQTQANYKRAAYLALHHGYKLSMQQHLFFGVP